MKTIALLLVLVPLAALRADEDHDRRARVALAVARCTECPDRLARVEAALARHLPQAKAEKPPCVCGDKCQCPAGACPAKCPVAPPSATELWLIDGCYYRLPAGSRPTRGFPVKGG